MVIAGEAAAKAGGDREKVRAALGAGEWDGILGKVKFEDYDGFTQQNRHQMVVIQYQDGKAETVYPKEVARRAAVYPFPGWK
jgi:branched-chain amino acid transport system substrate-binding protein